MLALKLEAVRTEVEQQPDFDARCGEIVDQLGFAGGREELDGLVLDDHSFFDEEIGDEVTNDYVVVGHPERDSAFGPESTLHEFMQECPIIDGFEITGPERGMHPHRAADDLFGQLLEFHRGIPAGSMK